MDALYILKKSADALVDSDRLVHVVRCQNLDVPNANCAF